MQKLQHQRNTHSLLLLWQSAIPHDWILSHCETTCESESLYHNTESGRLSKQKLGSCPQFLRLVSACYSLFNTHYHSEKLPKRNYHTGYTVCKVNLPWLYISEDKVWTFNKIFGTEDKVSQKSQLLPLRGTKYHSADNFPT